MGDKDRYSRQQPIRFTNRQWRYLVQLSEQTGWTTSEVVRWCIELVIDLIPQMRRVTLWDLLIAANIDTDSLYPEDSNTNDE